MHRLKFYLSSKVKKAILREPSIFNYIKLPAFLVVLCKEGQAVKKTEKTFSKKFKEFLFNLDKECYPLGIDGWVPIQYRDGNMAMGLWDVISRGERLHLICPGQTILDMGSGSGSSSIIWAHRGYNVIGVELNNQLYKHSRQGIRNYQKSFGNNGDINIIQGSYYPESYIQKRKKGKSLAVQIEDEILKDKYAKEAHKPRFHPVCETDIYTKYNIDLKKIDIFYAYKYKLQSPSVIEMFQIYSKVDAILCVIGLVDDIVNRFDLEKDVRYCYVGRDIKKRIKNHI